jgi:cyclase
MNLSRSLSAAAITFVLLNVTAVAAQQLPPGSQYEGRAWNFEQIAEGVYFGSGTGNLTVVSNSGIIINENDVLLVDSHATPAAATALLAELKTLTDKPVRYVVNTHFHWDHAHGNQIYPDDIEVIGHEYTRQQLEAGNSMSERTKTRFLNAIPTGVERLRQQIAAATDPAARQDLERRLRIQENYWLATQSIRPTPPNLTLADRMTLFRGGREIRLEFFGRGHTGGDVVIYLPAERVILTGDLLQSGLPYLGDAFVPDYIETLENLKQLEFDFVIPGHGRPFSDRERIDYLQEYLADFWAQVTQQYRAGASVEDAMQRIDMRAHAEHYPSIRAAGMDREAVERAYELLRANY